MEVDGIDGEIFDKVVDQILIEIRQSLEKILYIVLLILVDQSHGGVFKLHKGDQTLKQTVEDPGGNSAVRVLQELPVFLRTGFPVPAVDVGEYDFFPPLAGILHQRRSAWSDHGAAGNGNEAPGQTEDILAALFAGVGLRFHDKGTGYVIRVDPGSEIHAVGFQRDPHGIFTPCCPKIILPRRDGGVDLQFTLRVSDDLVFTEWYKIHFSFLLILFEQHGPDRDTNQHDSNKQSSHSQQ